MSIRGSDETVRSWSRTSENAPMIWSVARRVSARSSQRRRPRTRVGSKPGSGPGAWPSRSRASQAACRHSAGRSSGRRRPSGTSPATSTSRSHGSPTRRGVWPVSRPTDWRTISASSLSPPGPVSCSGTGDQASAPTAGRRASCSAAKTLSHFMDPGTRARCPDRDRLDCAVTVVGTGTRTGSPCSPARTAQGRPASLDGTCSHVAAPATGVAIPYEARSTWLRGE